MKMIKKMLLAAAIFGLVGGLLSTVQAVSTNSKAPDFKVIDTNGKERSLAEFAGKTVVLEWTNMGCPFVKKHYGSQNMQGLQKEYTGKGVVWLSVASSAKGKEGYLSADEWNMAIKEKGIASTAVLIDASGKMGKSYGAKTTPHLFIIDPKGILVYQGAIDSTPSTDAADINGSTNYVKKALDEVLAGKKVSKSSTESYGCSVKY